MILSFLKISLIFANLFLLIFVVCSNVAGQGKTGKAYGEGDIKRPASAAPQFPSPVTFTDFTAQSGINFKHHASATSQKYLPETMGAGVGLIDFDNDGRLDIFFTNGAHNSDPMPKGRFPDKSEPKYWNRLYRQKSDGTFEDVTQKSGVRGEGYGFGAAVGDYDKDGFSDLFVTHLGGAVLYRNRGNGTFADVTKKAGIEVEGWAASAGFFDYDRDGRLDLFVTRYLDWDFEKGGIVCGDARRGLRSVCHPDNFNSTTSLLFRQKTDGTFENASEKSGISRSKGKALGVAFADFDGDGWTDVFVANDSTDQQLFRNKADGTFEDVALMSGAAFDGNGKRFAGMGVDAGDYDNDAKPDVVITAFSGETYPLFRNLGDFVFDYATQTGGVGQITVLGTGWGVKFADADNDGRRDIFAVQGHVSDIIEKTTDFLKYKQPAFFIRNAGSGFQNASFAAGDFFKTDLSARGMAAGDLDNDGDVDFIISQTNGTAVVLKNNGQKNGAKIHWLGLDLRGEKSCPNGEGAKVTVTDANGKKQFFEVSSSGSYLAANDLRIIAGLGAADAVRQIEIRWTSGKIQLLENPAVDRYHLVKEK